MNHCKLNEHNKMNTFKVKFLHLELFMKGNIKYNNGAAKVNIFQCVF